MNTDSSKIKVLLVDDDAPTLEMLSTFLDKLKIKNFNLESKTFYSRHAAEIKEMINSGEWEIVILDNHLGANKLGVDILREVREEGNQIPIIIHSSGMQDDDVWISVYRYGGLYLSKPSPLEDFIRIINTCISGIIRTSRITPTSV